MSTEQRLTILRDATPNSWVAFSADEERIVATGATFEDASRQASSSGESDPLIVFIPSNWSPALL